MKELENLITKAKSEIKDLQNLVQELKESISVYNERIIIKY